ncbi:hypothetical protein M7I_5690 [Glarea lozoyensis 74030]|uniref:Gpi anchored protein n=1 Tax=Glarea lozoyensis (strain ATCC 74030 / MF5533) TaxID=1104152 RepID=H0ESJ9_GLAL7|nr:hypothetical protein M7I_5690 [Glarea lozoyensis 74030]
MQLIKISLLALLSGYAAAQDIDDNDVPTECRAVCQVVTQLTQQCDTQNNDIDSGYINCVCSYNNAASLIPACEACIANYDTNDGHDNDVNDLIRSCSFTTTVFQVQRLSPRHPYQLVEPGNAAPTTSGNAAAGRTVEMGVAGSVFLGVVGFLGLI